MQLFVSFVFRILIAMILGFFFALYIMQNDVRFKNTAQRGLEHVFGIFFDCQVEGTIQSFAILVPSPYIVTTNIRVMPKKGDDWKWTCERFILSFSWLDIIFGSNIGIKSDVHKLHAISYVRDNKICIMEHIDKIINTQQDLPFKLRKLHVNKGNFDVYDEQNQVNARCAFDCDVGNFNKRLQTIFHIADGTLQERNRTLIANTNLRISCDIAENYITTLFTGMFHTPIIDPIMPSYIQGCWKQNCGSMRVYNKNGSFVVDRCMIKRNDEGFNFGALIHIPLSYIQKIIAPDIVDTLQGSCYINAQGNIHNDITLDSKIHIQDIVLKDYYLGNIDVDISYAKGNMQGSFMSKSELIGNPKGILRWSLQEKKCAFEISNTTSIEHLPLRYWHVAPSDISISGIVDSFASLSTSYTCNVKHTKLETRHMLQGQAIIDSGDISIQGIFDSFNYKCQADNLHNFYIKKFNLDKENKKIITLDNSDTKKIEGTFSYDCVRSLAKQLFNYDLQGNGTIELQGILEDQKIVTNFSMKKGNIRLGATYNFIQNLVGCLEIETEKQDVVLKNCCINLHRGRLLIPYARCLYNNQLKQVEYCYFPIHLQNVFLNNERDIFMVTSGRVVITQEKGEKPIIKGNIFIDRGQIRQNIFSAKEQKSILQALSQTLLGFSTDVEFDITIETKYPIRIRTGFLESEIKVQLSIKGSLQHPHVSGKIFINDGIFHFPYKPLYITSGILYIMPHNLDDPAIELHAKGKIKRYTINMQVHGTLLDAHITFASTPPLSQEQIITLLLGGSETGSLSFVMPSLVMQNVRNLIFGSEQMSSSFERYVLSPLRYIRIVPSFTDQTGRGGFRGAIEIDVSDQLRAIIQKNFSLSEDTRFEVEYQVSDEISLRGLKDERGDIGGEIEMRFTF